MDHAGSDRVSVYAVYEEHDGYWVGWNPRVPEKRYEGATIEAVKKQLPIVRVRPGVVVSENADGTWTGRVCEIESVAVTAPSERAVRKRIYPALMQRVQEDAEVAAAFFALREAPPDSWEVDLFPRSELRSRLAEEMRGGQPMKVETGMTTPEGWVATEGQWGAESGVVTSATAVLEAEHERGDGPHQAG